MKSVRNIVKIDEALCTGCGQCILDCAEGAIQIVDGKAKVISDHLCDGLGACIGGCPEGALVIVQRPADAFDEEAVAKHLAAQGRCQSKDSHHGHGSGHHARGHHGDDHVCCGGSHEDHECCGGQGHHKDHHGGDHECCGGKGHQKDHHGEHGHHGHHGHEGKGHHGQRVLMPMEKGPLLTPFPGQSKGGQTQWPLKLRLVAPTSPFLHKADISLVADCAAALTSLPKDRGQGKVYLIGCPKLEGAERITEHLAEIFAQAQPRGCTVVHVDIPCCRKLLESVEAAKKMAGVDVPIQKTVVTTQGDVQA